jgi:hypothetical protein
MRMLRWISANTRKDSLRNEKIHLKIGMNPIDEKMRESCLRWFGHVLRRVINSPMRRMSRFKLRGKKRLRKTKKSGF